jgi:hypothetical protein
VRAVLFGLLMLVGAPALAQSPPLPTREPPPGQLKSGESVLVDDHTCPAGQVKQVTSGDNLGRGSTASRAKRTYACVARP